MPRLILLLLCLASGCSVNYSSQHPTSQGWHWVDNGWQREFKNQDGIITNIYRPYEN
jgi:hypothetical protein